VHLPKKNVEIKSRAIYFSYRKVLQRVRMGRSRKVMSKSTEALPMALRRALRFGGGGSAGHDEVEGQNLEPIPEDSEGATALSNLGLHDDVPKVIF